MIISSGLDYSLLENEGLSILDLSGYLTITSFDAIIEVVHNLTERESVIIDMKGIDFLSSSGLNALIEASYYAKKHRHRVILIGTSDDIIDLINFIDCHRHFIFAGSFEEAKTKLEYFI
jgi:anti-anti-sigma factor